MSVRAHVPPTWTVIGELPVLKYDPPLRITSPDGSFDLDVAWELDAFVGGALILGEHISIRAASTTAIREWVLGALEMASNGMDR